MERYYSLPQRNQPGEVPSLMEKPRLQSRVGALHFDYNNFVGAGHIKK